MPGIFYENHGGGGDNKYLGNIKQVRIFFSAICLSSPYYIKVKVWPSADLPAPEAECVALVVKLFF